MLADEIEAIGIDGQGTLWVKPATATFPYIYREAMEVQWDSERGCLYSPKPREWSYLNWFRQIVAAARAQGVDLTIGTRISWSNIDPELERNIRQLMSEI